MFCFNFLKVEHSANPTKLLNFSAFKHSPNSRRSANFNLRERDEKHIVSRNYFFFSMEYEAVIGLEIHVQLKAKSKVFAGAPAGFGEPPNKLIDPTVLALPGALPVLNRESVEKSVKFGLMIDAKMPEISRWSRKNYFYPDSPKNYQITQLAEEAIVGPGEVEIELPGPSRNMMGEHKKIRINHAHLEEDVGKLTHGGTTSLVDYNRAGTTLLEIVTEPDMHSAEEAVALLNALRMILNAAGLSDCDMEKGQLRCDANVSVRPKGSSELRTRTEMKNVNSLTGVRNCINLKSSAKSVLTKTAKASCRKRAAGTPKPDILTPCAPRKMRTTTAISRIRT